MNLDAKLLELIVCPACHADLAVDDVAEELVCTGCGLAYPVRDDIPVLVVDDGLLDDEDALRAAEPALRYLAEGGSRVRREAVSAAEPVAETVARLSDTRPRAVVAAGPDSRLLRAVLEPVCPVPFVAWPH